MTEDEKDKLKFLEAVAKIEWDGTATGASVYKGPPFHFASCIICRGVKPTHPHTTAPFGGDAGSYFPQKMIGHRPECILAKILETKKAYDQLATGTSSS